MRTREGIINLRDRLTALEKFMHDNATAAHNSSRTADADSCGKWILKLESEIEQLEKQIAPDQLEKLKEELAKVKCVNQKKAKSIKS